MEEAVEGALAPPDVAAFEEVEDVPRLVDEGGDFVPSVFELAVLVLVVFPVVEVDAEREAAFFEAPVSDALVFDAPAFDAPAFDALDFAEVVRVFADVESELADVDPEVLALPVDFFVAAALFAVPVAFSVLAVLAVLPAFVLRRRDDCIDAAGSLRADRELFCACSPSRSVSPPEKKTSTGRSLEFASGIRAPSPRPRPRFLRSATTYSSIRNFLGGLTVGERTARMWVI
ncbi:hypothetical protein [Brevibacterium atlanticum]|uniref:hypothetical protein n=1 Tax=Brevibacterium atlanticum TaxID=2697563 RepID=UPI001D196CCA|nr:hypothetical protein [Brevibacterium atlanticum]